MISGKRKLRNLTLTLSPALDLNIVTYSIILCIHLQCTILFSCALKFSTKGWCVQDIHLDLADVHPTLSLILQ